MSKPLDAETEGSLARVLELKATPKSEDLHAVVHRVIDESLIKMVFQPIVDLSTGTIFAYEALCRSLVPEFDNPPALIDAATEIGRIGELGRLQRMLASKTCPDAPLFVNISPHELDEAYLVRPDDAIFRHRHPVYIEITESVPLDFFEQCFSVLAELRRKGIYVAVDDLGSGYSNLKYIADLAPEIVKLDRKLVAGCTMQGTQYKLLRSIARLCRDFNAQVVAEGIENAEELEAVSSAGIELGQGYFLGRPNSTPSELEKPAAELITSEDFKNRQMDQSAARNSEDAERRVEKLERVRLLLELSVRNARREVVQLRKALKEAKDDGEKAQTRLANAEEAPADSGVNRRSLLPFEKSEGQSDPAEPSATPTAPRWGLKRAAGLGLFAAAGLFVGLTLYKFVPRTEELLPRATTVVTTPAQAGVSAEEEVEAVVLSWAKALSDQDIESYVDHYSHDFVAENGLSGAAWEAQRGQQLEGSSYVDVSVDDLKVRLEGTTSATAIFLQTYSSQQADSSDTFTDRVRKALSFVRGEEGWRIAAESVVE